MKLFKLSSTLMVSGVPMVRFILLALCFVLPILRAERATSSQKHNIVGALTLYISKNVNHPSGVKVHTERVMAKGHHWVFLYRTEDQPFTLPELLKMRVLDRNGKEYIPDYFGIASESSLPLNPEPVQHMIFVTGSNLPEKARILGVAYLVKNQLEYSLKVKNEDEVSDWLSYSRPTPRRRPRNSEVTKKGLPSKPKSIPTPVGLAKEGRLFDAKKLFDHRVGVSPSGLLVLMNKFPFRFTVFDPTDGTFTVLGGDYPNPPAYALAGNYLVIMDKTKELKVWDVRSKKMINRAFVRLDHMVPGFVSCPTRSDKILAMHVELEASFARSMEMVEISLPEGLLGTRLPASPPPFVERTSNGIADTVFKRLLINDKTYTWTGKAFANTPGNRSEDFFLGDKPRGRHFAGVSGYGLTLAVDHKGLKMLNRWTGEVELDLGNLKTVMGGKVNFLPQEALLYWNPLTGLFLFHPHRRSSIVFTSQLELQDLVNQADSPTIFSKNPRPIPVVPGSTWRYKPEFYITKGLPPPKLVPISPEGLRATDDGELIYSVPEDHLGKLRVSFKALSGGVEKTCTVVAATGIRGVGEVPILSSANLAWNMPHTVLPLDGIPGNILPMGSSRYALCHVPDPGSWWVIDLLEQRQKKLTASSGGQIGTSGHQLAVIYDQDTNHILFFNVNGRLIKQVRNPLSSAPLHLLVANQRRDSLFLIEWKPETGRGDEGTWAVHEMDLRTFQTKNLGVSFEGRFDSIKNPTVWDISPDATCIAGYIYGTRNVILGMAYQDERGWNTRSGRITNIPPFRIWSADRIQSGAHFFDSRFESIPAPEASAVFPSAYRNHYIQSIPTQPLWLVSAFYEPAILFKSKFDFASLFSLRYPEGFFRRRDSKDFGRRFQVDWESRRILKDAGPHHGVLLFEFNEHDLYKELPLAVLPLNLSVTAGQTFHYQVLGLVSGEKPQFSLGKSPENARINSKGVITWNVPLDASGTTIFEIIVTDKDDRRSLNPLNVMISSSKDTRATSSQFLQPGDEVLVLGAQQPKFSSGRDSRWLVMAFGRDFRVLEAGTLRVGPRKKNLLPTTCTHLVVRENRLYAATKGKVYEFSLPQLQPVNVYPTGLKSITDLIAPSGIEEILYAGDDAQEPEWFRVGVLNPVSKEYAFLDDVVGQCMALSSDGRTLATAFGITRTYQGVHRGPFGFDQPIKATSHMNLVRVYERLGSGFVARQEARLPLAPTRLSFSANQQILTATGVPISNSNRSTRSNVARLGLASLEPLRGEKDFPGTIEGWLDHPTKPMAVIWGGDKLRLFIAGKGEGIPLAIDPAMDKVDQVIWQPDSTSFIVAGRLRDGRSVLERGSIPEKLLSEVLDEPGISPSTKPPSPLRGNPPLEGKTLRVAADALPGLLKALQDLAPEKKEDKRWPELTESAKPSIVQIVHAQGVGTGFVIHSSGYVLTCDHVLPSKGLGLVVKYFPRKGDPVELKARVIVRDPKRDMAVLFVEDAPMVESMALSRRGSTTVGEEVGAIGHHVLGASSLTHSLTVGRVSHPLRDIEGLRMFQFSAAVNPGVSGGPVFDRMGNVIGMVTAKARVGEGISFAVGTPDLVKSLKESINMMKSIKKEAP